MQRVRGNEMAGDYTRRLYLSLKDKIPDPPYKLWCSHIEGQHKGVPYFGEYGHDTTLSHVDIVITEGDRVRILCEIEEGKSEPKRIIGDIMNIALSDKVCINKKNDYMYSNAKLILGLVKNSDMGEKKAKSISDKLVKYLPPSIELIEPKVNSDICVSIHEVEHEILSVLRQMKGLITSSRMTLKWLYIIKCEVEKKIPSVIYTESKYWAALNNPNSNRNFVYLQPQKGQMRLFTKLTPSSNDLLRPTPATDKYAEMYPSIFKIRSEDMIDNAVKLIILSYEEDVRE